MVAVHLFNFSFKTNSSSQKTALPVGLLGALSLAKGARLGATLLPAALELPSTAASTSGCVATAKRLCPCPGAEHRSCRDSVRPQKAQNVSETPAAGAGWSEPSERSCAGNRYIFLHVFIRTHLSDVIGISGFRFGWQVLCRYVPILCYSHTQPIFLPSSPSLQAQTVAKPPHKSGLDPIFPKVC